VTPPTLTADGVHRGVTIGAVDTQPGMPIPTIDTATFDAIAGGPGVLVVDFTAAWCAPCRTMAATLDALSPQYAARARFVAVDVDHEPGLAQRLGVRSMPTVVVWRGGREVGRIVGARPARFVAGVVDRAIAGDVAIAAP
jgi:thioredoxin